MIQINRVAVLGAGVMGATIAAHLANGGLDVLMLDIVPKDLTDEEKKRGLSLDSPEVRNRIVEAGRVCGMRDVEHNGDIGGEVVGRHPSAKPPDLFLYRIERVGRSCRAGLGLREAGQHTGDDKAANTVVQGTSAESPWGQLFHGFGEHCRVPDANAAVGYVLLVRGSDVHIDLMPFGDFLVFPVAHVDGRDPNDPGDLAVVAEDTDASPTSQRSVRAARREDMQESLVGNVIDDEANLVGMGFYDEAGRRVAPGTLQHRPRRAIAVALHAVGESPGIGCPLTLSGDFKACWARCVEKVEEKRLVVVGHGKRESQAVLMGVGVRSRLTLRVLPGIGQRSSVIRGLLFTDDR